MQAIKDYENNKWKVIGQKVGKPAKVRIIAFLSPFLCRCLALALETTASHRLASRRGSARSRCRLAIHFDYLASISSAAWSCAAG